MIQIINFQKNKSLGEIMFKLNETKVKYMFINKERLALAFYILIFAFIVTARSYWFYVVLFDERYRDYFDLKLNA